MIRTARMEATRSTVPLHRRRLCAHMDIRLAQREDASGPRGFAMVRQIVRTVRMVYLVSYEVLFRFVDTFFRKSSPFVSRRIFH